MEAEVKWWHMAGPGELRAGMEAVEPGVVLAAEALVSGLCQQDPPPAASRFLSQFGSVGTNRERHTARLGTYQGRSWLCSHRRGNP